MNGGKGGNRVITLTSDFGLRDPFVSMVKGEILKINPDAGIIDITHGIEPADLTQAAVVMDMAARHFPSGSIHVCVVDPGVGSKRRPILVITDDHYFIGPDNGVFSLIYQKEYILFKVMELTEDHFFRQPVSPVFHGRDIFGPVASWLSKGIDSSRFGTEISDFTRLPIPVSVAEGTTLKGVVMYVDRFGNSATNILEDQIEGLGGGGEHERARLVVNGKTIGGLNTHFSERKPGDPGMLINSTGRLEVFMNRGSAQKALGLKPGVSVEFSWG